MINEVISILVGRRSVRKFKPEMIREEDLQNIVKAGLYAPSGHGLQSAKFVVITNKKTIKQLSQLNATVLGKQNDPFYGAPVVIVVLANKSSADYINDGSVAIANMLNAACSLGIGSCWVHRAKQEFESTEGKLLLKEWGIEDNYEGIGHCILGYPDESALDRAPRKSNRVIYVR